jgi:predicted dehydrogenase
MAARVGIIGCGNISDTYLRNGPLFAGFSYVACADLDPALARRRAEVFNVEATSVDALLARQDIDAVVNLTVPAAHAEVSLKILDAGKHVFSEKPLAVSLPEGRAVVGAADSKGLRVGCAPDTVLGPGVQTARKILDSGEIGSPILGLAAVQSHGMEHWHPNPSFFYKQGGGPVLDLGPYYLSTLIHLLGPVLRVSATGTIGYKERIVTSDGPARGTAIKVETFTSLQALLSFASGVEFTLIASWDVWNSDLRPIELHATKGTLRVPDPNLFGGTVSVSVADNGFQTVDTNEMPLGRLNRPAGDPAPRSSCYRGLGLAEMLAAINEGRPHRCSGEIAFHALEVMLAIEESARLHRLIEIESTCVRPDALSATEASRLLVKLAAF